MKYNIYLLSYNNYNNRQVKKLNSINDYINGGYVLNTVLNCNFEYSDGITSQLLVNSSYVNVEPDYILVEDIASRVVDLQGNLVSSDFSRWFVIDSELIRGNQYKFNIKRDIWVDHYDLCMNSTYFIERGWVPSTSDLIFNNEQQQFSQIKKSQTPLYDETGCPWIVGYIPKVLNKTSDTTINSVVRPDSADYVVNGIANWPYWQYCSNNPSGTYLHSENAVDNPYRIVVQLPIMNVTMAGTSYQQAYFGYSLKEKTIYGADVHERKVSFPSTFVEQEDGFGYFNRTQSEFNGDVSDKGWYNTNYCSQNLYIPVLNRMILNQQTFSGSDYNNAMALFRSAYNIDENTFNYIENNLNGKTIKDSSNGKVYTISLSDYVVDTQGVPANWQTEYTQLTGYLRNMLNLTIGNQYNQTSYGYTTHTDIEVKRGSVQCIWKYKTVQINLIEVGTANTVLPKDDVESGGSTTTYRNHLVDQVYDMFAIPYGALEVKSGANTYTCNKDIGLAIAQSFVTTLGTDAVYDIQMLPYCPVREYIQSNGTFDITASNDTKVRPIYFGSNNQLPVSYVFYCTNSKVDNMTLQHKVNNVWTNYSINITDTKLQYNTEMYRLSSPNFASSFEFNAAQNGGVNSFLVSFTYKPYTPYIRVRPEFGRMFGQDFRDGRGLILQGDFSIPTMSNAWSNYELQNKNYQNTFNREIKTLNLQNKIGNEQDIINAITGSIQGTVSGAVAGGMMGGAYGAIAGAVIGGGASIAGGVKDVQNNRKLRNDTIDKAKMLFHFQMDNIKALPDTIRNVGCLTVDNILVPVLEFYQASDDEIDTFQKKMQYYGMAVMKVGTILEYVKPGEETFVQGELLRLLPPDGVNTEADNHLAEEISNELQKGLYIM